jgi:hypothetical protein
MSDRTAASLASLDVLLPLIAAMPPSPEAARLVDEGDALRRAVAAFHLEAIRFRMYYVDRLLKQTGDTPAARTAFESLREALEAAGFHTRSHTAP